ncbi:hypothetical protein O9G_004465 [Rozella allomycis CSF55]|uniref:Uncharacterized protein n=1 Tax=Rozella allomycis (strain CSF55) TaxID=988480 RepID=A0A075B5B6_ROZAC|nr:hypothetical protein O9G_004465 [Rozella allomycis CSF55]|eukprot:EPZ37054.1 hypothetical protein O9G_004465 [Rozella allomycis CSF55]
MDVYGPYSMDQNEDILSIIDRRKVNGLLSLQEDSFHVLNKNEETMMNKKVPKRLECLDRFLNWIKEIENR